MTPEEFLEKYRAMRGPGGPTNFNQRFSGDEYGAMRLSPNIEDRRSEGLARGMMGAMMSQVMKDNILKRAFPSAAAFAGPPAEGMMPTPLGGELGTRDLDTAYLKNVMPNAAEDMVQDHIDGLPVPTDFNLPPMEE